MIKALVLIASMAPAAFASPQGYGYDFRHPEHHRHKPYHYSSGMPVLTTGVLSTGVPSSAAQSAPYGLGNTTIPGSTGLASGTQVLTTTIGQTIQTLLPGTPSSSIGSSSALSVPEAPAQSGVAKEATGGACDSGTVTETYNPTVTVTMTSRQGSSGSISIVPSSSFEYSTPAGASTGADSPESASSLTLATSQSASSTALQHSAKQVASSPVPIPQNTVAASSKSKSAQVHTTQTPVPEPKTPTSKSEPAVTPPTSQVKTSAVAKPTTVTPSTASSSPVSSTKSAVGNKRGILASGSDQDALVSAFDNSSKITWLCNWYSAPPPNLGSHIEFVPQDYGKESNTAPKYEWTTNAKQAIAKGAKYFLGFGEPEAPDTATMHTNMDPQDAVTLYMKDLQPYAEQGIKVGAPAVLQPDPDLAWLKQFLSLCDSAGCKYDFIAIHWVWSATPAERVQDFKDTINNATALANGKKVWVDNFQASGTNEEQQQWLSQVLPWLEDNDSVERYAYVSPSRSTGTGFLNADGSMSSLGEFYANF